MAQACAALCAPGLVCDVNAAGVIACVNPQCTNDTGCERGFCVQGSCYRSLGICQIPAP